VKSFSFRLDRVLDWRRKQLDLEEVRFRQAAAAVAAVDQARAELAAASARTEHEVRSWERVGGGDLAALDEYRAHVKLEDARLAARRAECARAQADQQALMLEARRRCRLLERLRERRLEEWKTARDREMEEIASESYFAQWGSAEGRAL
jgi:hypothetical protein